MTASGSRYSSGGDYFLPARTRYELTSLLIRVYLRSKTPTHTVESIFGQRQEVIYVVSSTYRKVTYCTMHRFTFEFSMKLINCRFNYRSTVPKLERYSRTDQTTDQTKANPENSVKKERNKEERRDKALLSWIKFDFISSSTATIFRVNEWKLSNMVGREETKKDSKRIYDIFTVGSSMTSRSDLATKRSPYLETSAVSLFVESPRCTSARELLSSRDTSQEPLRQSTVAQHGVGRHVRTAAVRLSCRVSAPALQRPAGLNLTLRTAIRH